MATAYLVLADGTVFEGEAFGARGPAAGEAVFTTGVVGYMETLTDAAYAGQIVVQTFPHIGNYGVIPEDLGPVYGHPAGYVVREWCDAPSNFRCGGDVDAYLKAQGIPGICGVDTRALTRHLREHGTMNAMITDTVPADLPALAAPATAQMLQHAPKDVVEDDPQPGQYRVTVVHCGCGIVCPDARLSLRQVPPTVTAEAILAANPDGVILSGGAGDPAAAADLIETVKALLGRVPLLGVGLGHEVMALAMGGRTEKLHHGHRGPQPVRDPLAGRTFTAQMNCGYAVTGTVPGGVVRYENVNDGTVEGLDYPEMRAMSVSFAPILSSAAADANRVWDAFITMLGGER